MTAFLEKLRRICVSTPPEVAGWSVDGRVFEVRSTEFESLLKNYFKGTLKTFIRQLHFYGFTKSESVDGSWTFSHPKFSKDNPDGVLEITRKTRMHSVSYATKDEVLSLRKEVASLKNLLSGEIKTMRQELSGLLSQLGESNHSPNTGRHIETENRETNLNLSTSRRQTDVRAECDLSFMGDDMSFVDELMNFPIEYPVQSAPADDMTLSFPAKRNVQNFTSSQDLLTARTAVNPKVKKQKVLTKDLFSDDDSKGMDFLLNGFALPISDFSPSDSTCSRKY